MRTTRLHPLAEEYFGRLEEAARGLPSQERDELLTELRSHLEAGLPADATDAEVRNFLLALGPPHDIVAAAGAETQAETGGSRRESAGPPGARPAGSSPWGLVEVLAVLGLTIGAVVLPVVGPLAAICLAWTSSRWTRREKVIATVLTALPVLALVVGGLSVTAGSPGSEVRPAHPVRVVHGGSS